MSFLELEPLDVKKMGVLFGPMGAIHTFIANMIIDIFKEDEVWELWLDFYNRTYMIWHNSEVKPE